MKASHEQPDEGALIFIDYTVTTQIICFLWLQNSWELKKLGNNNRISDTT